MARKRREQKGKAAEDAVFTQLYAVEPEVFVAERKRLARALRDEGRQEEAEEVAARPKPTLPVFAANRLARERADEIAELIDVAEELTAAHRTANAAKLRDAQSRLGEAIRAVVAQAEAVTGRSLSEAMEQRLGATLRAAATDSSKVPLLRGGVLSEELEPTGFDALAGLPLPRSKKSTTRKPKRTRARTASKRSQTARGARIESPETELEEASDELRTAERALAEAERREKRARERVSALEQRLARARSAV